MTTKEAIERSMVMWKWLLANPTRNKEDYPWPADEREPRFQCYLCEHCQMDYPCPVDWSGYEDEGQSSGLPVCDFQCENHDSPFSHWFEHTDSVSIEAILRLLEEALGKLERGELENREDNSSLKTTQPATPDFDRHEGVAGFGDSPTKAMWDFDRAWHKDLPHNNELDGLPTKGDRYGKHEGQTGED